MAKSKEGKEKERKVRVGAGNVVSQIFFAWVFWFIILVRRTKDLKKLNLVLRKTETSRFNDDILDRKWKEEKKRAEKANKRPFIRNALIRAFGLRFIFIGIWKVVWEASLWFGAYWLLQETIAFVRAKSSDFVAGQMYALGFLLSSLVASVAIHQLLSQSGCLGLRVKSALMVQIFKKSLVLARIKGGAGDVVNLVSNDCSKIADAFTNLQYLWSCVVEVILILILVFVVLGYSACPALGIIIVLTPLQLYLGRVKSRTGFQNTMTTSRRVHIMSEILTAIKLIKFYAWEQPFYDRISEMREREMRLLRKNLIVNAINFMAVFCVPVIVALLCLLTYWLSGHTITSVVGFTVVSVFNTLRYPLLMAPLAVNSASDALSALKRLDEFFSQEEIQPAVRYPSPTDSDVTVSMEGATFVWDLKNESSDFSLKKMSFTARRGKLTAIVGDVGSGKSSFLAALLGQMVRVDGESKVLGSIGYVPQEAWLLNMSLRDNIIFGSPFDEKKYREVIKVCALSRDISLMPNGDATEIGERGINLSGGQRQRISLARCVYKLNDIILLDDPLSAVDQQVGKHIFTKCIKKYFREKTVIFVTHQLQYLHQCDDIVVIKDGRIIEHGSFNDLMRIPAGHMATLVADHVQVVDQPGRGLNPISENEEPVKQPFNQTISRLDDLTDEQRLNRRRLSITANYSIDNEQDIIQHIEENQLSFLSVKRDSQETRDPIRIIEQNLMSTMTHMHDESEEHEDEDELNPSDSEPMKLVLDDQSVNYKKSPMLAYLRAGYGIVPSILLFMFFFLVHGVRIGSDYWLSQWFAKASGNYKDITDAVFVGVYGGAVGLFTIGVLTRGLLFAFDSTKKSIELHSKMFKSVIYAQMSFFDTTPIGRVLNAFARHQYAVDAQLADSLMQLLQYTPLCMGAIILCMTVMYQTIGVFGGAAIIATLIILFVGKTEERLRNKEAVTKSTIFSHLTASLEGLFSIRAYQCEDRFIDLYSNKIDENHSFAFGVMEVKCWTAFYLDVLVSVIIYTGVEVVVLTFNQYPASTSGLVLSNVLQLLVFLQWAVRMFGEVREKLGSIKQITYYGNCVKQEALPIIEGSRPPENWPTQGNIKFESVVLKYQELGVAVLKGVTLNIKPKEKIGIVGRTGSGKSTLLISLLRIVELSEGKIIIDGLDVSKFGLKDLRSRIAIIPQEPILFVGTIRENVDLFQKNTDEEIWKALDSVHLGNFIRKLDQKLDSLVIENGKNFSVGQRQLFCIARAILSKTQILVLDEATAAVDLQTDKLIQDTIKENFANLTVLTIAHRLNTIMESDKILVMDAGRVIEFAPPLALLDRPNGAFYSLLKETGPASFNKLKKVAMDKAIKNQNVASQMDPYADPDNIIIDMKTLENQLKKPRTEQQPSNIQDSIRSLTAAPANREGVLNQGYVHNETNANRPKDPSDVEVYVSSF